jgi:hypothetical protein
MRAFTYERASSAQEAATKAQQTPDAKFIAGGTNLLDLMKLEIETPRHLIDVNGIGFDKIEGTQDGGVRVGALVRNTTLAADMRIRKDYGVLSRALLAGASGSAPQQGDDGGQSAAAYALPVFLRHQSAMQQEKSRVRLRGDRRFQPPTRRDRRERLVHRHQPLRYGGRHAGARCPGGDHRCRRPFANDCNCRFSSPARRCAADRDYTGSG